MKPLKLFLLTALAFLGDIILTFVTLGLYLIIPTKKMLMGRLESYYIKQILKKSGYDTTNTNNL
jgi:hypothetical protein